ncbi:MAG: hypothetical protein IIV42_07100 [Peptococcaceae bacterium]|nr:hypothetical protein [Peptococcaceae bacterium]
MKNRTIFLSLLLAVSLFLFCGCEREQEVTSLRIVDGAETGQLVLAGERESDVYMLDMKDIKVFLDGKKADASALEDGMMAEIVHSGWIQTTYPGQFSDVYEVRVYSLGSEKNPGGSYYDVCGLYLQVLEDLWNADPGLNSEIQYISVDLTDAPGNLTDGEKAAIAWIFGGKHGVQALTLSSQELQEQGYFTEIVYTGTGLPMSSDDNRPKAYLWEDGVLFTIIDNMGQDAVSYSLPIIKFNAWKWRTPLGAYWFSNCSAVWPQMGVWSSYNIEHEMIS